VQEARKLQKLWKTQKYQSTRQQAKNKLQQKEDATKVATEQQTSSNLV